MSINSLNSVALQPQVIDPSRAKLNAVANTFDAMSDVATMIAQMAQNLAAAKAQLGATPGAAGPQSMNPLGGIGALLQSASQLLTMLTPLLQALSNTLGGANLPANNLANQLPGNGLGVGPSIARPTTGAPAQTPNTAAGGTLGSAIGGAVGGPAGAAVGQAAGQLAGAAVDVACQAAGPKPALSVPGNGLGVGPALPRPPVTTPVPTVAPAVTNATTAAGAAVGTAIGQAVGGAQGAIIGQQVGAAVGQVVGQAVTAGTAPTIAGTAPTIAGTSSVLPNQVIGADIGANTQAAALAWARATGGPNLTQAELTQGMNLYSIFNNGQRMA